MVGLLMVFLGGVLEVCVGVSANRGGYPSFTDEIPFKITWPGAEFTLVSLLLYKQRLGRRCCRPCELKCACNMSGYAPSAFQTARDALSHVWMVSARYRGPVQGRRLRHHDNNREGEV